MSYSCMHGHVFCVRGYVLHISCAFLDVCTCARIACCTRLRASCLGDVLLYFVLRHSLVSGLDLIMLLAFTVAASGVLRYSIFLRPIQGESLR